MLIRFEVSNFRSIRESVELSMVAIDRDRDAVREAPMLGESLVTVAGIYGPNASGKSNVVAALAWLADAVRASLRLWDDGIPVDPFAFTPGPDGSTEFTIELLVDGVRYEYFLELDVNRVHYEALFHHPERRRRRIFEREGSELKLRRGLGKLSGTRELLTDRTLALSIARRFDEPIVVDFANELIRAIAHRVSRQSRMLDAADCTGKSTRRIFRPPADDEPAAPPDEREAHRRQRALELLRVADLGIEDVTVDVEEMTVRDQTRQRHRLRLLHGTGEQSAALDFEQESDGTQAWFSLIGPLLSTLEQGSLLVMDELDASLHPTLCARLIELFHSPDANPKGAQLVFTSHDTSLLAHLDRDEVWLTEKQDDGATELRALIEFGSDRVRRSRNLEAGYLHGRFGALPDVDQPEFLRPPMPT